jgi:hypothetical protein
LAEPQPGTSGLGGCKSTRDYRADLERS